LVLEPATHYGCNDASQIRRVVHDDEVLSARLSDQTWIVSILPDISTDSLDEAIEDRGRTGEVHAGEAGIRKGDPGRLDRVGEHQVDDAIRQAGFRQDLHDDGRRQTRRRGRLP